MNATGVRTAVSFAGFVRDQLPLLGPLVDNVIQLLGALVAAVALLAAPVTRCV